MTSSFFLFYFCQFPSSRRFLVFAHHQSVLNELDRFVRSKSTEEVPDYIRIDGKTPADMRQANVDKFQKEEGCRIALLSITAAGTGITLHAASHVVFAELIWTPAYLVQAEDRGEQGRDACVNTAVTDTTRQSLTRVLSFFACCLFRCSASYRTTVSRQRCMAEVCLCRVFTARWLR